jgi:TRAP-type C4-dicarboxylate transport system substrate-binding protein
MPYVIVTTEEKWNSLSEPLQQALNRSGERLYQMSVEAEHSPGAEQKAREAMMKGGVKWHDDFPQEDREAFLAAAAETWAELAEDAGGNAPAWRQRVIDAIGR